MIISLFHNFNEHEHSNVQQQQLEPNNKCQVSCTYNYSNIPVVLVVHCEEVENVKSKFLNLLHTYIMMNFNKDCRLL